MQKRLSYQDKLAELNQLGYDVEEQSGKQALNSIKNIIDLYVQHQKSSEDFFMSLCQYNVVQKLLTLSGKHVSNLQILQTFNLLLANSSKGSTLVYLFSQPLLHQFLFQTFVLEKQTPEAIQYYVQLLKTIILKISQPEHHSMIKLFCNSRCPHFPLLTTAAILGVEQEAEELVRVTANQCVLLLIGLLNKSEVGLQYLCELQIVVYYHSIIEHMFWQQGQQKEQELRFIIDLVNCLQANTASLCFFMNLLTNHLLFRHQHKPHQLLAFLISFYAKMEQHTQFPSMLKQQILLVLGTIITKYLKNQEVNYTYFSALRNLPHMHIPQKPNLLRFYKHRCKELQRYLIRESKLKQESTELNFVLDEWLYFNDKNVIVSPMRNIKHKPKSAISQFFTSKEQNMEKYIQSIMTLAGIQSSKLKNPLFKLSYSTDYQTALYLVELVCTRYGYRLNNEPKASQNYSIQYHQLSIQQSLLIELYNVASIVQKNQLGSSLKESVDFHKVSSIRSSISSRQSLQLAKMEGFSYIVKNLRHPLIRLFCTALTSKKSRPELNQFSLMSAIAGKLSFSQYLQPIYIEHLLGKLKELQIYISEDLFSIQNFYLVFRYISKGRQKSLLKKVGLKYEESPRKKNHAVKTRIECNFIQYEVIKRLIDTSVTSLTQFVQQWWRCKFFTEVNGIKNPITLFKYKQSSNCMLEVMADDKFEFILKKTKHSQTISYQITRDDCNFDKNNPTILSFEDHNYLIDFQTVERANNFRDDLNRLREERKQLIMNGIFEYLTFSYQTLSASAKSSMKESSMYLSQKKYKSIL